MSLIEPLRIQRDKLGATLLEATKDVTQRKAILALLDHADFDAFEKVFLFAAICPECQQTLHDVEEWESPAHQEFYNACREVKNRERAEYHDLVPMFA
jgi:hypothetical protein